MNARPTLVLLHSSAASARQWDTLARSLVEVFDVHAIDLHGHGVRAAWHGGRPLTLADEAAPVDTLIERRGAVHLVGHSYGGAVALDVARRHPHAVRSVAVFEPVLFGLLAEDRRSQAQATEIAAVSRVMNELVARGQTLEAAARFVDYWSGRGAWAAMPASRQAGVAARVASVALHFDAAFTAPDPRPALQRMPLLCLAGSDTPAPTQRIAALLEASLPQAEHHRLTQVGHMGPLSHPAVVNACITDFLLRQVDTARRAAAQPSTETTPA